MDNLHIQGIFVIKTLQNYFKNDSHLMISLSYLSDPKYAFLFYFPLAFCLHRSVGKRVLWVAAISEWLNAVFKWILHGERPYWWINESSVFTSSPKLDQFEITCETGPGSPSGHCMVTSAVIYILVSDFIFYQKIKSIVLRCIYWSGYIILLLLVCLSRLFIAAHFPHQVIGGIVVGVCIGAVMNHISTTDLSLKHYVVTFILMLAGGLGTFFIIQSLGVDPFWSLELAKRWCANPEWIHLDSSLFFSIIRDATTLIGLGFGVFWFPIATNHLSLVLTPLQIVISLSLTIGSDWIDLPTEPIILFYILSGVKFIVIFFIVVAFVPKMTHKHSRKIKVKTRKNKVF